MTRASNVVDLTAQASRLRWKWLKDINRCAELKPRDKSVALALAGYFNEGTGKAWPAHETLAADCGSSVRFVHYALKALRNAGFLRTERNGGGVKI